MHVHRMHVHRMHMYRMQTAHARNCGTSDLPPATYDLIHRTYDLGPQP